MWLHQYFQNVSFIIFVGVLSFQLNLTLFLLLRSWQKFSTELGSLIEPTKVASTAKKTSQPSNVLKSIDDKENQRSSSEHTSIRTRSKRGNPSQTVDVIPSKRKHITFTLTPASTSKSTPIATKTTTGRKNTKKAPFLVLDRVDSPTESQITLRPRKNDNRHQGLLIECIFVIELFFSNFFPIYFSLNSEIFQFKFFQ